METNEKIIERIRNDIEAFGAETVVYAWFQFEEGKGNVLNDYSLEPSGKCIDPETLENLLEIANYEDL